MDEATKHGTDYIKIVKKAARDHPESLREMARAVLRAMRDANMLTAETIERLESEGLLPRA